MAAVNAGRYESLSRRHGVKVECRVGVEECCLAAGQVVGHSSILSASRMNKAVIMFLDSVDKANDLIRSGIVLNDQLVFVQPLSAPAKKIILSNVPPFIKDELIVQELSRFGKVVSPVKKVFHGCKSLLMKHLVSFRRFTYMVLKNADEELNLTLKFKIDGFDYIIYVTSDTIMKCFRCKQTGHFIRDCPESGDDVPGVAEPAGAERPGPVASGPPVAVPPAVVARPPAAAPTATPASDTEEPAVTGTEEYTEDINDFPMKELNQSSTEHETSPPEQTKVRSDVSDTVFNVNTQESVDMIDEPVFKVPFKRKQEAQGKEAKQCKKDDSVEEQGQEGYQSDSEWSECSQDLTILYTAGEIKDFLRKTKGQRGVKLGDYFPDKSQFVHDVKHHMSEGAFNSKEVSRLKKIKTNLNKSNHDSEIQTD